MRRNNVGAKCSHLPLRMAAMMHAFTITWSAIALLLLSCKQETQAQNQWLPSVPLVDEARKQVGVTVAYNPAYEALAYPNGDVPRERGVCTDVVIRAMRDAHKLDLQELVHKDMAGDFSVYPKLWNLTKPDRNIDHRRVPNLQVYFKRMGWEQKITTDPKDYHPGDLVTCTVSSGRPHIMLVSNQQDATGIPLVLHNIGSGTREESVLFTWPLTGHYRKK